MRKLCSIFALVLTATGGASAQLVSLGALGGVRLTDGLRYADESRPYVVGGSVEIHLPARFAIEADALYQRIGDTATFLSLNGVATSSFITRERGNSWQFPLYVKYYFRPNSETWQPFIGTGYAFRTVSFHTESSGFNVPGAYLHSPSDFRSNLGVGASITAGLRFHYGRIAIVPQARYTRWGDASDGINKNEASLLLGLTF